MRIVRDEKGQVVKTECVTAPPASGLFCARDERGIPVSDAGKAQEPAPPAEAPPRSKRAAPSTTEQ